MECLRNIAAIAWPVSSPTSGLIRERYQPQSLIFASEICEAMAAIFHGSPVSTRTSKWASFHRHSRLRVCISFDPRKADRRAGDRRASLRLEVAIQSLLKHGSAPSALAYRRGTEAA